MKRNQLALALMLLFVGLPASVANAEKVVVRIAHHWDAQNTFTPAYEAAAAAFEAKHPNIDIQVETGWSDDKYKVAVATGEAPDIFTLYMAPTWAVGGFIQPLDKYAAQYGVQRADFVPGAWDQDIWRGKLYAIPLQVDSNYTFVWNKDLFSQAGYNPDRAPKTIHEFDSYLKKLTVYKSDATPTQIGMGTWVLWGGNANTMYTWGWLYGGEWYDYDNRKATAQAPGNIQALDYLTDQWQKLNVAYTTLGQGVDAGIGRLVAGREAMQFWPPSVAIQTVMQFPNISIGQDAMPSNPDAGVANATWIGGWSIGLTATSKVSDEAFQFMQFLTSDPEGVAAFSPPGQFIPANFRMPTFRNLGRDPKLAVTVNNLVSAVKYRPAIPAQGVYNTQLNNMFPKILRKQITPQAAMEEVSRLVDIEMQKYK